MLESRKQLTTALFSSVSLNTCTFIHLQHFCQTIYDDMMTTAHSLHIQH